MRRRAVPIQDKRFVYSRYWGTWSRVLKVPGEKVVEFRSEVISGSQPVDHGAVSINGSWVELNLTPVNGFSEHNQAEMQRCRDITFRIHCTSRDPKDICADDLPAHIKGAMRLHYGSELTERLLTEDFLSQIDLFRCRALSNGGCSFARCKKEG